MDLAMSLSEDRSARRWVVGLRTFGSLMKEAFDQWSADNVSRLGAALAYYSVFAIAPLVVIVIAVASLLFGQEAAHKGIVRDIESTVGTPMARAIQDMLANNKEVYESTWAAVAGVAVLLIGAAGVFGQ